MARTPYRIELSESEERELRRRARQQTRAYREVLRAKIVLLAAEGLENAEIARRLDTTREAVSRWRKRFYEERLQGLEDRPRAGRPRRFSPRAIAEVKAIACQLPSERGLPLSRFSSSEIAREAVKRGIVEQVSGATVWRWLAEDAIRPWSYRSWIFPRDPDFRAKAARVLDLYAGRFEGKLLHPGEYVVCADEKPSIQARARLHPTAAPVPGGDGQLVEHEYERMGALCYLAAWDVRRAKLFDRGERKGGIEPFDRLVAQVMTQEPYASARRVFWIVDNGSSHRGHRSIDRLQGDYKNLVLVHLPVHASWLNQIEIYFSIVERKVLQPNDLTDLAAVEERLLRFGRHYEQVAQPFEWRFTRDDLDRPLERLDVPTRITTLAA